VVQGEVFLCQNRRDARPLFSCSLGLGWRDGEHPVVRLALLSDHVNPLRTFCTHPFLLTLSITQLSGWHPILFWLMTSPLMAGEVGEMMRSKEKNK
jgi:hypothetical protein